MKFVWQLHSTIFVLIKLLQMYECVHISIAVLFLTKSSLHTSSQHLPFQSLNSKTRVGHERCSRFIKFTTKTKVNCCKTFDRFEQTLYLVWVFLWPFYKKHVNGIVLAVLQCRSPHIFIMLPTTSFQRTITKATSKNLRFPFLENHRVR